MIHWLCFLESKVRTFGAGISYSSAEEDRTNRKYLKSFQGLYGGSFLRVKSSAKHTRGVVVANAEENIV